MTKILKDTEVEEMNKIGKVLQSKLLAERDEEIKDITKEIFRIFYDDSGSTLLQMTSKSYSTDLLKRIT